MQKFFTQKAFLLLTLFFILIAGFSFAAFRETEQVCTQVKSCCKMTQPARSSEMLWEVVSRQFLSLVSL
ncbi:hypothetical protein [Flavisolibacter nicotianae]|uniref:hypothetical protein n=1 Tax=Flavisolibacter nicotianae TaxID=2364882 RepID=UPI000EACA4D5|nr:hypothetical protein [Flavisolibacter nicotianae]